MKKSNDKSVIKPIEWAVIAPQRGSSERINPSAINVKLCLYDKRKSKKIDCVRLRIGGKLTDKLKWKKGDRICAFYDPNDIMHIRLARMDTVGYLLGRDSHAAAYRLQFKWPHEKIALKEKNSEVDHYVIENGSLIFRLFNREGE